jgi:hypothetical protein
MFTRLSLKSGFLICAILCTCALPAHAQSPVPVRDPNALALASRALQALAGGKAITDITLQARATYIAGSDQDTGPATLVALGNQQSRVTLSLTGGQRQEIRNGIAGAWVGQDGTAHATALHNCWTDASWFFPALSLAAAVSSPQTSVAFIGLETKLGIPVAHLQISKTLPRQPQMTPIIQRLSASDLYLDASSSLPVALDFNVHPENDAGRNIAVEIRYSNYQVANGIRVPLHIQKYQEGTLTLDLAVTNAVANSGVSSSFFVLLAVSGGKP